MISEVWVCDICLEYYDWESEAESCCPSEWYSGWKCDFCYTIHDSEIDADTCCPEPNEHEDDCAA